MNVRCAKLQPIQILYGFKLYFIFSIKWMCFAFIYLMSILRRCVSRNESSSEFLSSLLEVFFMALWRLFPKAPWTCLLVLHNRNSIV